MAVRFYLSMSSSLPIAASSNATEGEVANYFFLSQTKLFFQCWKPIKSHGVLEEKLLPSRAALILKEALYN